MNQVEVFCQFCKDLPRHLRQFPSELAKCFRYAKKQKPASSFENVDFEYIIWLQQAACSYTAYDYISELSIDDRQRVIDTLKEIGDCDVGYLQRKLDLDKPIANWRIGWHISWPKKYYKINSICKNYYNINYINNKL